MICTSWAWPNMFDVARNKVGLLSDVTSIVNRTKLLMLTEPTEMYMCPNFGVGLKKYMFNYNNDNVIAMIKDSLIEQLRLWEPAVVPEKTTVTRGLKYSQSGNVSSVAKAVDNLDLTVTLETRYGQSVSFGVTTDDINGLK